MSSLRVGDVTWTLADPEFGLGRSGEWTLTARRLDAKHGEGQFALFGYVTPWPCNWPQLRGAQITAAVEDPGDTLFIDIGGRLRIVAPYREPDAGAVLRVDAITDTSITLSYVGPFLLCNDDIDPDDTEIDVELVVTARRG